MKPFYDIEDEVDFGKFKGLAVEFVLTSEHYKYWAWVLANVSGFCFRGRALAIYNELTMSRKAFELFDEDADAREENDWSDYMWGGS